MYHLRVLHPGAAAAAESVSIASAPRVLELIPELLARHAGCERIDVFCDDLALFSVDCRGATIAGGR